MVRWYLVKALWSDCRGFWCNGTGQYPPISRESVHCMKRQKREQPQLGIDAVGSEDCSLLYDNEQLIIIKPEFIRLITSKYWCIKEVLIN